MASQEVNEEENGLFENKQAKGKVGYSLFATTIFAGVCLIWLYRIVHMPRIGDEGRWVWIGMFMAELFFGIYWIFTQSVRWSVTSCHPFKHRLSQRYGDKLPGVDIFVCTADPVIEPPSLVVNTILSVMAYNYPTENLAVYLSDDGGSEFTFYALLEASHFSKHWIPFCKRHSIEPRSPEAYFSQPCNVQDINLAQDWISIKKLFEEMKHWIDSIMEKGSIPKETRHQHKGFLEWDHGVTKKDHQSIVQIIIDGRETSAVDDDGCPLPTLVYVAREKRPDFPHNFKAGAMNALIRVSSEISHGSIILNLDCDMYANDADAIRDALCFFMDDEKGHEIAYVQHPQAYNNITKNDVYGNASLVVNKVELAGLGGYGAALYCGTGCFHRRESLCGKIYSKDNRGMFEATKSIIEKSVTELETASKILVNCSYEEDTQWGKKMGLVYGCPVEDIVTGLNIQCRGWKSIYYKPNREAFLGLAPNTLDLALIQHKRWSEGMFQIFWSKYCPFTYGHGKLKLAVQMGYCVYLLWAPLSLPTLYYVIAPPLCLLHGIPLFPQVSNLWFIPFAYVFVTRNVYSVIEFLSCGSTLEAWWNLQRMTMFRRTTAYFLAFIDTIVKKLGLSQTAFDITPKIVTEEVLKRYGQEVMEFGSSSDIMLIMVATLAILNIFGLVGGVIVKWVFLDVDSTTRERLIPHVIIGGLVVLVNFPVYEALFLRHDKGRIPPSVVFKSIILASLACLMSKIVF